MTAQSKSKDPRTRRTDDTTLAIRLEVQENARAWGGGGGACVSLRVLMLKDRGQMSMALEDCQSLQLAD